MKIKYSYLEYMALPLYTQILYKIWRFLFVCVWSIYDMFKGIFIAIWHGCIKVGVQCKKMFISLRYGDWATKVSFLCLGVGYIKRKQIVKGIVYIILEILFILFMILFGGSAFANFASLGPRQHAQYYCTDNTMSADERELMGSTFSGKFGADGDLFDSIDALEDAGCLFHGEIAVSNSSKCLLFGVIALIVVFAFVCFYAVVTANAFKVECNKEEGKHINTFSDDVKEYLNGKFHITLLFLPVIGVIVFNIFPLVDMILMAFTNYDKNHQYPTSTFQWVGLKNFGTIFDFGAGDGSFSYTFGVLFQWTIIWAILATVTNFVIGILVATIINKKGIKLKKMWRTFLVLSIAIPQFVSLLTMSQFLSDTGTLAVIISNMTGKVMQQDFKILGNGTIAKWVIIIVNIWIGVPYTVLSTTGILMNIPADLYESAKIDGANAVRMYTRITIPYIIFVLGPSLITTFIGNVNNFGVIYLLTGGAPKSNKLSDGAGETSILITWLWALTKDQQIYYLASVIGIIIFIISAILSLLVYRNSASYKNEEDFA